jgi:hypothetical protein
MISAKFEWWFKHSGESIVNADRHTDARRRKNVEIPAVWKFVDEAFTVTVGTALTIGGGSPRGCSGSRESERSARWRDSMSAGVRCDLACICVGGGRWACTTGSIDHGGGMAAVARREKD